MDTIEKFWHSFAEKHALPLDIPEYWMFGDGSKEMGDELAQLVLAGKKTGTCSAKESYLIEGEAVQTIGQYDIVLDGDSQPVAIIRYTNIEEVPMNEVSEAFALSEGEGDLTYEYWYSVHETFFKNVYTQYGLTYTPTILLVCQTFEVVFSIKDALD